MRDASSSCPAPAGARVLAAKTAERKHPAQKSAGTLAALLIAATLLPTACTTSAGEAQNDPLPAPSSKSRVLVLTDIENEPDDAQSLVRFLLYVNEMDVEGLLATTSVWMRQEFTNLFYVVTPSSPHDGDDYKYATWVGISGDHFHGMFEGPNFDIVDNPWLSENIRTEHGPLAERYPATAYLMEGDTPSFMNLFRNGLAGHVITPASYSRKYRKGGLTNPDPDLRRDCIELYKAAIPPARELGARYVKFWPGQDGYDYPFQADYEDLWKYSVDAVREVAAPDMQFAIECKFKEPRTHMLFCNVATTLLAIEDMGVDNVGIVTLRKLDALLDRLDIEAFREAQTRQDALAAQRLVLDLFLGNI